jgi:hypothetical protein
MATKKSSSGSGGFQATQVTAPSFSEMVGNAASGTGILGNRIIGQNIAGGRQSFLEGAQMLRTGGAFAMNPALQAQFDEQMRSLTKGSQKDSKTLVKLQGQLPKLQDQLAKAKTPAQRASIESKIGKLNTQIEGVQGRLSATATKINELPGQLSSGQPNFVDLIKDTNKEMYGQIDRAQTFADQMGQMTDAGRQLMDTGRAGFQAREIGRGAVGDQLYSRATEMAGSTGQLSPEAARNAVQSARQAFSARGLGTSMGSAAAELLNRDQYSRQRMFQDLGFAQGIQQQDMARQQANEESRRLGTQLNMGMLGDAVNYEQGLQNRGLGASLQMAEIRGSTNPYNVMLGFDPFGGRASGSQAVGPASQLSAEQARLGLEANAFNANATNWQNALNRYGNYGGQQSGMGAAIGGIGGMALGAGVGALLAAPTGGMSVPMGMAIGSGVGGGLGTGLGGLFGR